MKRSWRIVCVPALWALVIGGAGCDLFTGSGGSGGSSGGSGGAGTSVVLSMTAVQAPIQAWDWAAATEEVADYFGAGGDQCEIASVAAVGTLGSDCCPAVYTGACLTQPFFAGDPDGLSTISFLLAAFGLQSTNTGGPISFAAVQTEINNGRPILALIGTSFTRHWVVIYGYDLTGDEIYIHDPWYGAFVVPYGTSFTYAGFLAWEDTIAGIDVL